MRKSVNNKNVKVKSEHQKKRKRSDTTEKSGDIEDLMNTKNDSGNASDSNNEWAYGVNNGTWLCMVLALLKVKHIESHNTLPII